MAFPTIPTVAAGRAMSAVDASTASTRTFPNLSSLTKNSGDLLIAIVLGYQSTATANAVWSSWGGGFTEFGDFSSTTTCTIGLAYKWSTGSETGTFTVTQASAITGHAAMILLSIPGAHATTPPEAVGSATGSAASIDPPSLNPANWDVADTLWIAVGGLGETSTSGAWDGISSGPSGYSDYFETGVSADAVGAVELAVAFLQSAVSSENPGTFTNDSSNTRYRAATIGIRPAPASHNGTATNSYTATITTTGKPTYKGQATNTYTAAVTTSGTSSKPPRNGEVGWAYLKLLSAIAAGQTILGEVVGITTQAKVDFKGQTTLTETAAVTTQGSRTRLGQTTQTETVGITTVGKVTPKGQTTLTETASLTTDGKETKRSQSQSSETVSVTTSGKITAKASSTVAETASITTSGTVTHTGQTSLVETVGITTSGSVIGLAPREGEVAWAYLKILPGIFTGQTSLGLTDSITTSAKIEAFGETSLVENAAITTSGNIIGGDREGEVGWAYLKLLEAAAVFGEVSLALTDSITANGVRTTFGVVEVGQSVGGEAYGHGDYGDGTYGAVSGMLVSVTTDGFVAAANTYYGQTSLALTDSVTTSGTRTRLGQTVLALTDSITTQGRRVYFSKVRVGNKTPFTLPGTATQSSGGQAAWTNIDNIKADDGSVASVTVTNQSENLFATGLGLDVHGDVRKVFVEVETSVDAGAILRIQLTKSASYEANDYQEIVGPFSGTTTLDFHPYTLGEPDSFWLNTGLTPAQAEGSGFGVDFYVQRSSGTPTVTIDYVKVRVVSTIEDLVTSLGSIGQYGLVSTSETVGITTTGKVTAKSQSSVAESATITTSGSKTTHSTSSVSEVVTITTSGQLTHFTWYGIASTNLTVGSTTTGKPNFKGLVTTSGNVTITTVANILAHAQVSAAFLLNIRTRPQSLVFLTEADCADLIALAEECDDLSMNGASDSQLALVGAEDT